MERCKEAHPEGGDRLTARIFDLYRGTSHDGPGLRSTVFFQGCPLSCAWCHNPEGMGRQTRVWWDPRTCIGCMRCRDACPNAAIQEKPEGLLVDEVACRRCGACTRACPTGAMAFTDGEYTLDALVREVLRDRAYYEKTGGGVTASGGECMLQAPFLRAFFARMKEEGIDTALDTCGFVPWDAFESVLPFADHVLYDLKIIDGDLHRHYTGHGNGRILENAGRIARRILSRAARCDLWIRTPLIPGATATEENVASVARFIQTELSGAVARWELPAFNNSCLRKYEKLGLDWAYRDVPLLGETQCAVLRKTALRCGLPSDRVIITGLQAID